jgi:hypothetical protein
VTLHDFAVLRDFSGFCSMLDRSPSESGNQVGHFCGAGLLELMNELLLLAIGVSDPLVLAQMLNPGASLNVSRKRPSCDRSSKTSHSKAPSRRRSLLSLSRASRKGTAIAGFDLIFDGHQHWWTV